MNQEYTRRQAIQQPLLSILRLIILRKWYEQRLKKVLRDRGISVKKLSTVRRESEVGIQLADALAGLIRYHYDNPDRKDAKKWFDKLKKDKKLVAEFTFDTDAARKLLP